MKIKATIMEAGKVTRNNNIYTKEALKLAVDKLKGKTLPLHYGYGTFEKIPDHIGETEVMMDNDHLKCIAEIKDMKKGKVMKVGHSIGPTFTGTIKETDGPDGTKIQTITDLVILSVNYCGPDIEMSQDCMKITEIEDDK